MGWEGGTEIAEAVIEGFDDLVVKVFDYAHRIVGSRYTLREALSKDVAYGDQLDDMIRPHVRRIASLLEDKGWDSQEETAQFDRFAQEIMGYDDGAYTEFLRHKVTEATHDGSPEDILTAARRLKDHTDKTKAGKA